MKSFLAKTLDNCIAFLLLILFFTTVLVVFAPVLALIKFSLVYLIGG